MTGDTILLEVKSDDFARYQKFCSMYNLSAVDCFGYFMDWLNIFDLKTADDTEMPGVSHQFIRAAELGDTDAQYELGMYYMSGVGVGVDLEMAVFWLEKVAEKGFAKAQFQAGMCHHLDYDDVLEVGRCAYWFSKAAEQGHARAQYMYGSCYFVGDGVDQDYDKAEFWFRKAAAQGDADAKRMLELMYDTPKVKTEAVEVL